MFTHDIFLLVVIFRKLVIFRIFIGNIYPALLLAFGINRVYELREDNYGCGDGNVPEEKPDGKTFSYTQHDFCVLSLF